MKHTLALMLFVFSSSPAFAALDHCSRYGRNTKYFGAIKQVARHTQYSEQELCSLPRLLDIHVTERTLVNDRMEYEPHTWVTLHYNEYSCQYFVRDTDQAITRSNCYSTF